MQHTVRAGVAVEQRREAAIDPPVEPVALALMKPSADDLDHLLRDQMTIPEPELVMVSQR